MLVGANPAHKTDENEAILPVTTADEDTDMLIVEEQAMIVPDLASFFLWLLACNFVFQYTICII